MYVTPSVKYRHPPIPDTNWDTKRINAGIVPSLDSPGMIVSVLFWHNVCLWNFSEKGRSFDDFLTTFVEKKKVVLPVYSDFLTHQWHPESRFGRDWTSRRTPWLVPERLPLGRTACEGERWGHRRERQCTDLLRSTEDGVLCRHSTWWWRLQSAYWRRSQRILHLNYAEIMYDEWYACI